MHFPFLRSGCSCLKSGLRIAAQAPWPVCGLLRYYFSTSRHFVFLQSASEGKAAHPTPHYSVRSGQGFLIDWWGVCAYYRGIPHYLRKELLVLTSAEKKSSGYGWRFPEEIPENFRKDTGNALRAFLEFPARVRLGSPKPEIIQGIWSLKSAFPEFSPPRHGGASQSWSWNSQQC